MYPGPRVVDPEFRCFVGLCEFLRLLMLFCASICSWVLLLFWLLVLASYGLIICAFNFSLANNNLCFISPLCTIFLNFFSLVSMSFCVTFICLSACLFVQYFVCFTLFVCPVCLVCFTFPVSRFSSYVCL